MSVSYVNLSKSSSENFNGGTQIQNQSCKSDYKHLVTSGGIDVYAIFILIVALGVEERKEEPTYPFGFHLSFTGAGKKMKTI